MDVNDVELWNRIEKEYISGRKDQFKLDHAVFRRTVEETMTREELIAKMEEKFDFMIFRIADERARYLMEYMELV